MQAKTEGRHCGVTSDNVSSAYPGLQGQCNRAVEIGKNSMALHGHNEASQCNRAVEMGEKGGEKSMARDGKNDEGKCNRAVQTGKLSAAKRAIVSDAMRVFLKGVVVGTLARQHRRTYNGVAGPSWTKIADALQTDKAFCKLAASAAQDAWVLKKSKRAKLVVLLGTTCLHIKLCPRRVPPAWRGLLQGDLHPPPAGAPFVPGLRRRHMVAAAQAPRGCV